MKRLVFILAFIASTANADGLSYLGMCHPTWDCKRALATWQGEPIGWLENTFGDACSCADRFLQREEPKTIRVHLINSPCMRNKRCGRYEVLYKETAASASRKVIRGDTRFFRKFNRVLERFKARLNKSKGGVTCYISSCLECDLNAKARRILADTVSAAVPMCNLVDNPYRQRCLPGTICEQHGVNPRLSAPCIIDLDGIDGKTVDRKSWLAKYRHCDLSFYWERWMNCLPLKDGTPFIDPRKRGCRFPT